MVPFSIAAKAVILSFYNVILRSKFNKRCVRFLQHNKTLLGEIEDYIDVETFFFHAFRASI